MGDVLWTLLHLAGDAALIYAAGRSSWVAWWWRQSKRHDATMARIAQLEIACGVGLDWAKEWFDAQSIRGRDLDFNHIAQVHCYGCNKTYQRNGGHSKLCPSCLSAVRAAGTRV